MMMSARQILSAVSLRQIAFALLVGAGAIFAGLFSVIFSELAGGRLMAAIALPMALMVVIVFLLNSDFLITAIFFVRAGADLLLNYTRVGGGAGLGFVFNVLLIASVLRTLVVGDKRVREALNIWLPFIAIALVGVVLAPDRLSALKTFIALATFVAAFCVGVTVALDGRRERYLKIFMVASAIPFLWSIGMLAMGSGFVTELDGGRRFSGAFGHPNILAFFCVLNCALVLYFVQMKLAKSGFGDALAMAHMMQSLGLLLLTKTRSAWAGVALLFLAYAIFYRRRYFIYIALVGAAALAVPEVRDRIFGIFEPKVFTHAVVTNSFEWRLLLWENALQSLSPQGWILGNGLASFAAESTDFFDLAGGTGFGAHSIYVQTIYELGLVGLALFLLAMLRISINFVRVARQAGGIHEARFGGFVLLTFLMFGYADNMFNYTAFNYYFFCVLGMFSTAKVAARQDGQ